MTDPGKLLIATNNAGKLKEYASLLQSLPFELTNLAAERIIEEVEETGASMMENAVLKATVYARLSGLVTLADDSGLEVDALGGEPGTLSRRYAGERASDSERNSFLLMKLRDVPREKRTARFRAVIAIAAPEGRYETFEGICEGLIAFEPGGEGGFGYDPIFYLPELDRTMAELSFEEKNKVSHRARAARKARKALERMGREV
ncbi:MAG: XTP/dITP diphosphatase [Dehalococcoidia bacterium]|nr:XTP/dITP diphosphatase [Dehalococcoidia bacterium]